MPRTFFLIQPVLFLFLSGCATLDCPMDRTFHTPVTQLPLQRASAATDIARNNWSMSGLCARRISFKTQGDTWKLLLVTNIEHPQGPFWYLPHDNENTAFDAAVYAVKRYGGGFLAVESGGGRYFRGKDPNRNFRPGTAYARTILEIIDSYKPSSLPYLTLHTNKEGHMKFGGEGTVSMRVCTKSTIACPAREVECGRGKGLKDEDCLVYLAGRQVDRKGITQLNRMGMHVKFEKVNRNNYDNSMSNYIALYRPGKKYYNIETEEGELSTQKEMIDRVMQTLYSK